jgi:3-hydroxybutyryl-CoA dehydratase
MYAIKSFEDIRVGDRVSVAKTITEMDAAMCAAATGDFGPVHMDEGYAGRTRFGARIAPGIMVAGICTSVLTSHLVGVAPVSIEDRFWFTGPVRYGDTLTVEVWIAAKNALDRTIVWEASARNQNGVEVLTARATLKHPRRPPPVV